MSGAIAPSHSTPCSSLPPPLLSPTTPRLSGTITSVLPVTKPSPSSLQPFCSVIKTLALLCHACQLGHHIHLPFHTFTSCASSHFDLIHCDIWTSPIVSVLGYKYYLVILNNCSHYLCTFHYKLSLTCIPLLLISLLM